MKKFIELVCEDKFTDDMLKDLKLLTVVIVGWGRVVAFGDCPLSIRLVYLLCRFQ